MNEKQCTYQIEYSFNCPSPTFLMALYRPNNILMFYITYMKIEMTMPSEKFLLNIILVIHGDFDGFE